MEFLVRNEQDIKINPVDENFDYGRLLQDFGLTYQGIEYYYQVGNRDQSQGWVFHVSIVAHQFHKFLGLIIPVLKELKISFKIAQTKRIASMLCDGGLLYSQIGKVMCVYPDGECDLTDIAKKIMTFSSAFRGPEIPTDFHLGGNLYATNSESSTLVPYNIQKGVKWPFQSRSLKYVKKTEQLNVKGYWILSVLKNDAKGRVMRVLTLRGLKPTICILKEAKSNVFCDDSQRDIRDRLEWQFQIQKRLQGVIPLPAAYDFFKGDDGNCYLSMELIKGASLHAILGRTYACNNWNSLEAGKRNVLLRYLVDLIDIIIKVHEAGYVHRDVTPVNFLVTDKGKIVLIDLELTYSLSDRYPEPPFKFGTEGFMSPEQRTLEQPTIYEDVYSIGALMISFFTNLFPSKFDVDDPTSLREKLFFLVQDESVSDLITGCLNSDKRDRPELRDIRSVLSLVNINQHQLTIESAHFQDVPRKDVEDLISKSVKSFSGPELVDPGKVWHSNYQNADKVITNRVSGVSYYYGLYAGVAGVVYTLSLINPSDADIDDVWQIYQQSLNILTVSLDNRIADSDPGLYQGGAGIALALSVAAAKNVIQIDEKFKDRIESAFKSGVTDISFSEGVSGMLVSLLNCRDYLGRNTFDWLVNEYVDILLRTQLNDGSWIFSNPSSPNGVKFTGVRSGVSGVVIALLKYYKFSNDLRAMTAARRGLQWLQTQIVRHGNDVYWEVSDADKYIDTWFDNGYLGVILCFTLAFEVFEDSTFKEIAESSLRTYPSALQFGNFSVANGVVGVGEVYLQAYRVFKSEEWLRRANWIVRLIAVMSVKDQNHESHYWRVTDDKFSTADLMVGNSGVIHFLNNYLSIDTGSFPIMVDLAF